MHRHRLTTLGVALLAALGLMALLAVGAEAANLSDGGIAGKLRVEGSTALSAGVNFGATQEGPSKLLIASKNAYIECKKGVVTEGKGISESEITATVLSEECKVFEDKSPFPELAACPVEGESASKEKGKFSTKWIGLPKLHEGELYILYHVDAIVNLGPNVVLG